MGSHMCTTFHRQQHKYKHDNHPPIANTGPHSGTNAIANASTDTSINTSTDISANANANAFANTSPNGWTNTRANIGDDDDYDGADNYKYHHNNRTVPLLCCKHCRNDLRF